MVPSLSTNACIPRLFNPTPPPVEKNFDPVGEDRFVPSLPSSDELQLIPPPAPKPVPKKRPVIEVKGIKQRNGVSCGQTAVVMAVNKLTGQHLTDRHINARYGFGLLKALNDETGRVWRDGGEMSPKKWKTIEKSLDEGGPVVVALNGPRFSPSGRGHIVLITGVDGNRVDYMDPATGKPDHCSRQEMERAPRHPQGNFIFYPRRKVP